MLSPKPKAMQLKEHTKGLRANIAVDPGSICKILAVRPVDKFISWEENPRMLHEDPTAQLHM